VELIPETGNEDVESEVSAEGLSPGSVLVPVSDGSVTPEDELEIEEAKGRNKVDVGVFAVD
jgi:hypothetical protein